MTQDEQPEVQIIKVDLPKVVEVPVEMKIEPAEDKIAKLKREHAAMTKSLDSILEYVVNYEREQGIRLTKLRSMMGEWGL